MKKQIWRFTPVMTLLMIFSMVFVLGSCRSAKGEGFAIYLTRNDVPPSQMEALSHVDLAGSPLISPADVITYVAQTHELKLTGEAFARIAALEVPTRGKSFMVCVDKAPLYWGAFWTPISSQSFDGVTIWKPFPTEKTGILTLDLGYPASSFYKGQDPRNNPVMLKSLDKAGKLIEQLTLQTIDKLPNSMKTYELYSWSQDDRWHFTLITGTDRDKSNAEIVSSEDFISQAGWVDIHVEGIYALGTVFSKLIRGDGVTWLGAPRSEQTPESGIVFGYPPAADIQSIKQQAEQYGVDLQAP
jgi:hypothetical protein